MFCRQGPWKTLGTNRRSRARAGPSRLFTSVAILACSLPAWSAALGPQSGRVAIDPRPPRERSGTRARSNIRLDVGVVLIPVTVTDPLDRPVTTLGRNNFRVSEDGVEQKVAALSQEDGPISAGLLFDTSNSMRNRIAWSMSALQQFFNTSVPGDEFFLVGFSDEARMLTGFTAEPAEIFAALGLVQPRGWTALLDAICLGIHKMKSAKNSRRTLLVLSDGGDNNSRFTAAEVRSMALEADVRIFAIGLFSRAHPLQELAAETGGRLAEVRNPNDMPGTVLKLSEEIRSHYVLAYTPTNHQNDGKYRRVKVEVAAPLGAPALRVSWRRGYYAPYR